MNVDYRIGCSGYYYSYWKNRFYPKGLQPREWLQFYSTVFNTVELNGTFYRTPKLSDLQRYDERTPADFTFSVKMSRYISHVMKLNESRSNIREMQDLLLQGLGNKLSCFLFQMPPSYVYSEENLERILNNVPNAPHNVVELRHISWWNPEVEKAFKTAGITFCNVDYPGMDTFYIHTTPLFYLRIHGSPQLFKSTYSKEQLAGFYERIPAEKEQCYIYFNNTYYSGGYENAQQMIEIQGRERNA